MNRSRVAIHTLAALAALGLAVLLGLSVVVSARLRYVMLASDARNIDDVQVAIGRHLASADPAEVVWAIDGGAVRYFGNAFVVDLLGVNTPPMPGPDGEIFLRHHPPRYIEAVPAWSYLNIDSGRRLGVLPFQPFTPYTVTSFEPMRRHWIDVGVDPSVSP